MEQFKIRKDGFKEIKKETLFYLIPIMLIVLLGSILFNYFNTSGEQSAVVYFISVPLILGTLIFGAHRGLNMQKEIFENYRLTIDDNSITREQYNTPTIIIAIADISEIRKNSKGNFTIKGNSVMNVINIPAQIDNYEKVEQLLSAIKPISYQNKKPIFQMLYMLLINILTFGLMGVVYFAENKIIVGICGAILLVITGYSIFAFQKNKNFDKKTKKSSWIVVFPMVFTIIIMYYKISK